MAAGDSSADHRFDVFLSHAGVDKASVEAIAHRLGEAGLRPFLDTWHLVPGVPWQDELSAALADSGSVAVFIGPSGSGPWQHEELRLALSRAVARRDEFRVIPVLLPGSDPNSIDDFLAQRTWVDFRPGLDDDVALQRLVAGVRGEAYSDDHYTLPDEPAPYRGLLRFEADDARFFFGREPDVDRLVELLRPESFVAVVGASGSGKSSLVRAGLLPRLEQLGGVADGDWRVLVCAPGRDPFRSLAEQVARLDPAGVSLAGVDELTGRFRDRTDGLITAIGGLTAGDSRPVLLVVDQFEELFTLGDPTRWRADATQVVANLAEAVSDPARGVRIVATLRADFVATALSVDGLSGLLQDRQVLLGALTGDRLREAIVRPAEQVGALFEKGLVGIVMGDVDDEPGALPLLQHALFELWTRRRGPWLTIDAYQESGGVVGALSTHAESVYQRLPRPQQEAARAILIRLTTLGEGVPDTRRRARRDELYPGGIEPSDVDAALLTLSGADARLVVIDGDTVELAHEALLRNWARVRGWLDADRDALRVHRRLSEAAHEWERDLDCDPTALYAGARLAEAIEWAEGHGDDLNDTEQRFLDASTARTADELAAQRERARRLRRRLIAATAAFALALVGVGAAFWFLNQANDAKDDAQAEAARADSAAEEARTEAGRAAAQAAQSRALALAAQSETLVDQNPALAMALAAESMMATPIPRAESRDALVSARAAFADMRLQPVGDPLDAAANGVEAVAFSPDSTLLATGNGDGTVRLWDTTSHDPVGDPLQTETDAVGAVAVNPDGSILATAGDDGTVRLWDTTSHDPVGDPLRTGADWVGAVAFSPDGTLLATAGNDGTVRLWDPSNQTPVGEPIQAHDFDALAVAFSPDGTMLATAGGEDGTVRLWDSARRTPIGDPIAAHPGPVESLAFNPDGTLLASASRDGTIRLSDPASGTPIGELVQAHTDWVEALMFSPDGTLLATAGIDGTVRLWDPSSRTAIGDPVQAHTGRASALAFSPDGTMLATAGGEDGTARLWDPSVRDEPLRGHTAPVLGVAFSPDGTLLATAGGEDGTARLWDHPGSGTPIGVPLDGQSDWVGGVAFSPDGSMLATAGGDGAVQMWDADTRTPIGEPIRAHTDAVDVLAFSPDGSILATAGPRDGTVRLWDAHSGAPIGGPIQAHADWVEAMSFNPSGTLLATAGFDGTVRLWDPSSRTPIGDPLTAHTGPAEAVAFNPDGSMLATAGGDWTVRLWDPSSRTPIGEPLTAHSDSVDAVAFNPDGTLLASAGRDGTVRLWDLASGAPIGDPLEGHTDWVEAVAFSPDGTLLASASLDGTVRLWDAILDPARACELAAPYVRRAQVLRYLPPDGVAPTACVEID